MLLGLVLLIILISKKKINHVNSLEFIKNAKFVAIFDHLTQLKDGWCNGEGFALNSSKLEVISNIFIENYPECLPLPLIVPTIDGNLLIEWNILGYPSIDINITDMKASYQAFGLNGDKNLIEKEFTLTDLDGINNFFNFLTDNIK
jgi:hypothetical protein